MYQQSSLLAELVAAIQGVSSFRNRDMVASWSGVTGDDLYGGHRQLDCPASVLRVVPSTVAMDCASTRQFQGASRACNRVMAVCCVDDMD